MKRNKKRSNIPRENFLQPSTTSPMTRRILGTRLSTRSGLRARRHRGKRIHLLILVSDIVWGASTPHSERYRIMTRKVAMSMIQSSTSQRLWMAAFGLKKKPLARICVCVCVCVSVCVCVCVCV